MRFLPVGLFLFASTALGQTLTLTVNNATDPNAVLRLGRKDCDRKLELDWAYQGTAACEELKLWVAAKSCGDAPATGDYVLDAVPAGNVGTPGTRDIEVTQLPAFNNPDGGTPLDCAAEDVKVDVEMVVCGFTRTRNLTTASCDASIRPTTPPKVRFDSKPPGKPTISSVTARDSALGVTVDAEADSTVVVKAHLPEADGGLGLEVSSDETSSSEGIAQLTGLQNGVTYRVTAVARDVSGNTGDPSDPSEGTPVKSNGFYEAYVNAGGQETGGCGAAGGGIAGGAVLAALGFWLSRRKQS